MSEVRIETPQDQLELIFNTAPTGIALLNEKLEFITCNAALLRMVGHTYQEVCAQTFPMLCDPPYRDSLLTLFSACSASERQYVQDELRLAHKEGYLLWVEITLQHIPEGLSKPGSYVAIIQNIQERKELQLELYELRRRLTESHELERKNLAQELHDGPMQDLHSILYQIAGMNDDMPEGVRKQMETIARTVENVNNDLRAISYNLRQPALSQFGLAKSIRSHADDFMRKHPELQLKLELVDDRNLISEEVRLALFRIYQQSLVNIIRHANATEATIRLNLDGDAVIMEIIDNGVGFVVPKKWISLVRDGHYGLAGAIERVNALHGIIRVDSTPGKGAKIFVYIPDYMEK